MHAVMLVHMRMHRAHTSQSHMYWTHMCPLLPFGSLNGAWGRDGGSILGRWRDVIINLSSLHSFCFATLEVSSKCCADKVNHQVAFWSLAISDDQRVKILSCLFRRFTKHFACKPSQIYVHLQVAISIHSAQTDACDELSGLGQQLGQQHQNQVSKLICWGLKRLWHTGRVKLSVMVRCKKISGNL